MYQYLQWINQNCDIVTDLVAKWKEMYHFLLKIWYSDLRSKIKNSFIVFEISSTYDGGNNFEID